MTQTLIIVSALAVGASAYANDQTGATASSSTQGTSASSVRLSKLMDANIQSNTGEDLGQLEDLVIDPATGEIQFAVLGRGGFLGIGEKYVPVPWKAIQVQSDKQFTINVDKQKLKDAPTLDRDYASIHDPGYTVTVYRFFAVPAETGMGGSEGLEQETSSQTNELDTGSSSDTLQRDPDEPSETQ